MVSARASAMQAARRAFGASGDSGEPDLDETSVREALVELAGSARRAGRKAVVSGRWLGDTVVELAPRIPVRDLETLSAHHDGLTGPALAKAATRAAARVSAGIAAATGALITAQQLSVVTVLLVPFELAAATALVTATELKLIAELHAVAGRPLGDGRLDASRAALMVWTSGHALAAPTNSGDVAGRSAAGRVTGGGTAGDDVGDGVGAGDRDEEGGGVTLGRAARRSLVDALRKRFARNLTALGPMFTGAAAAGVLNRQATVGIGNTVARDLGLTR